MRLGERRPGLAVAIFFGFKIALGAAILIASAQWMTVASFAVFSQLLILIAYLASIGTAGVQNGLIRQIAAANSDAVAIGREVRAALSIWAIVALIALCGSWLLRGEIAVLLTGTREVAWVVPWLALLAMWSGLGQLLCSVLTGTGRAGAALLAQGIGLLAGTLPALMLLHRGLPAGAAIVFTAGQGVTTLLAGATIAPILHGAWRYRGPVRPEISRLLAFSGAFLATASIMPLTLIGLRSIYRTAFGLDALGYWLAANRISDVNTQLLGLYMVQAYLPAMARAPIRDQRRLAFRTAAVALGVMALPLLIFLAVPSFVIRTFLSAKFLPASAFFAAYFLGDMLRVGASVAAFSALAHARLKLYVALEAVAAMLMAIFVVTLSWAGRQTAPAVAYVATYGLLFLAAALFLARRRRTAS